VRTAKRKGNTYNCSTQTPLAQNLLSWLKFQVSMSKYYKQSPHHVQKDEVYFSWKVPHVHVKVYLLHRKFNLWQKKGK